MTARRPIFALVILAHANLKLAKQDLEKVLAFTSQIGSEEGAVTQSQPAPGTGLRGQYFANATFTGPPKLTRQENVAARFSTGRPALGMPKDNFSIRWEGKAWAPYSGNYVFRAESSGGIRIWIDNVLVIENWPEHSSALNVAKPLAFTEGSMHDVRVDFVDRAAEAAATLQWQIPGESAFVAIPTAALPALGLISFNV